VKQQPYKVATTVTTPAGKLAAVIQGPGLGPGGMHHEFSSNVEAFAFVDAMNLAFNEGVKDGDKNARH
jgi:hypothetical protein